MSKDDIVTQLRDEAEVWPSPSLYSKAAAEIERLRAAAKAVLSALDKTPVQNMTLEVHDRREALRAALAQPAASGEPVAWIEGPHGEIRRNLLWKLDPMPPQSVAWSIPLYTMFPKATSGTCTPQPAPARVPLTDAELDALWRAPMSADWEHREFARAIEAAHGITAPEGAAVSLPPPYYVPERRRNP